MTAIAVSIAVDHPSEVPEALERAERARTDGATLVEWRIDGLGDEPDAEPALDRLLESSALRSIVTCRPTWEGGRCSAPGERRASLLGRAITGDHPAHAIDAEFEAWTRDASFRAAIVGALRGGRADRRTSLVLSSHDFEGRPPDLLRRLAAIRAEPLAETAKLAWTARSLRDNLEAFDLLRSGTGPTIALCMGPFGLPSRVLAGKFGARLTFASADPTIETAPGQPTVTELLGRYRFGRIGPATKVYGVVGWPVGHSMSPALHNAGFDAIDHDGVYLPLPIPADPLHLKATLAAMLDHDGLDLAGLSVTIPHKAAVLEFVEANGGAIEPLARRCRAANTILVGPDGGLEARTTDAPAAVEVLAAALGAGPTDLEGRRAAILGAGGVARAIAAGLMAAGASVTILNRTVDRATALARDLSRDAGDGRGPFPGSIEAGDPASLAEGRFDVLVNATPIGMVGGPDPDADPLTTLGGPGAADALGPGVTVLETVYAPRRTPLIALAERRGANVADGWSMFLRQAELQFEAFTGRPLPAAAHPAAPV